jgi:hypothetical protein
VGPRHLDRLPDVFVPIGTLDVPVKVSPPLEAEPIVSGPQKKQLVERSGMGQENCHSKLKKKWWIFQQNGRTINIPMFDALILP